MGISRRRFLTGLSVAAGATAVPAVRDSWRLARAQTSEETWHKAPCRFCGTGCGVEVAVREDRVVAARGDSGHPVNHGMLCARGYALPQTLYGADRLTSPLVRNAETGELEPTGWEEALDLVATRFGETIAAHGPDAVALYGSGQWSIPEGYAALKLMKGCIRTNNIETNSRLYMASAVAAHRATFGIDGSFGCYEDLDEADVFLLWGANPAETHPMLFQRMVARRQADEAVRIIQLTTLANMTSLGSDEVLLFKPHGDLRLANALAKVLLDEELHSPSFVASHVRFGGTDVNGTPVTLDLESYRAFLAPYAPEAVAAAIGISAEDITRLARLLGDPQKKVVSFWAGGMNQHQRGTWVNELVYNLHLLTGKLCTPGNGAFAVSEQCSDSGTSREVGVSSEGLPGGRLIARAEHRAEIESIWGLAAGTLRSDAESPLVHACELWRQAMNGQIKAVWIQCTNPFQSLPDLRSLRESAQAPFIVVSDVYPSLSTAYASVVLPSACWVEKEGYYGNSERRIQHFDKLVEPPGLARSDAWQLVEVARRMGFGTLFPSGNDATLERELYAEYAACTQGTPCAVPSHGDLVGSAGLRWPVAAGVETSRRFTAASDPNVSAVALDGIEFYGHADGRAVVFARSHEDPQEMPDANYPFWLCTGRLLEHWHTGTLTRRVPQLHRSQPSALCYIGTADAEALGLDNGDRVRITSRRGSIELAVDVDCRIRCPQGIVFVPTFDESALVNELTLGALDPDSHQPDYKKCAVKVEKA
jgi:nitrate reductase NapA